MKRVTRRGVGLLLCLFFIVFCSCCSVTRTITTKQSHIQNGDTISTLTTRTQETIKTTTDLPLNAIKPNL